MQYIKYVKYQISMISKKYIYILKLNVIIALSNIYIIITIERLY